MPDETNLSRRAVLGALGGIGAGAALGGTGTMAYLNDTERTHATVTAGELDIKLDWRTVYNGTEQTKQEDPVDTAEDGTTILTLDDVKPGDHGCIVISIHNDTNPAWIWHRLGIENRDDNGLTEPEEKSGDSTGGDGEGELQNHVQLRAFYDDNFDCEWNEDEECGLTPWRKLTEFVPMETDGGEGATTLTRGLLLDGVRGTTIYTRQKAHDGLPGHNINISPFFPSDEQADRLHEEWYDQAFTDYYDSDLLKKQTGTQYLTYQWRVPKSVGNEIQSDSVDISFTFYAEQARHNGYPKNPWTDELPDFSVDLVPGVDHESDSGDYYQG